MQKLHKFDPTYYHPELHQIPAITATQAAARLHHLAALFPEIAGMTAHNAKLWLRGRFTPPYPTDERIGALSTRLAAAGMMCFRSQARLECRKYGINPNSPLSRFAAEFPANVADDDCFILPRRHC